MKATELDFEERKRTQPVQIAVDQPAFLLEKNAELQRKLHSIEAAVDKVILIRIFWALSGSL